MRETGLRLLTWGVAQLWAGLSADERAGVRGHLRRTHEAVGWPADPATDPPPYDGPEEIPLEDRYRVVAGYVACHRECLGDAQKAVSAPSQQREMDFAREATVPRVAEVATKAAAALEAMARGHDDPAAWGDLYEGAFWRLIYLRRAGGVAPRGAWPPAAMEQRALLAEAAGRLLSAGVFNANRSDMTAGDVERAFDDFTAATRRLRELSTAQPPRRPAPGEAPDAPPQPPAHPPGSKPKPKRTSAPGDGRVKLVAALTKHHRYADSGCPNPEPVGNNQLATLAGVDKATASAFFKKAFRSHADYTALCRDTAKLVAALKLLNGECFPHLLYGSEPPPACGE